MSRADAEADRVGLCARCANARRIENKRGSSFWQCEAAARDPRLRRYPQLPVRACPGHREGTPRD